LTDSSADFESVVERIVNLDYRIYSCLIVSSPSGAALAEVTRPEMRNTLGNLNQKSDGMVGQWGILAFKALSRLNGVRTRAKYLVVGREKFNAIIFPMRLEAEVLIGLTFDPKANPTEIYDLLCGLFEEINLPMKN
jgi:hypothetical protein